MVRYFLQLRGGEGRAVIADELGLIWISAVDVPSLGLLGAVVFLMLSAGSWTFPIGHLDVPSVRLSNGCSHTASCGAPRSLAATR